MLSDPIPASRVHSHQAGYARCVSSKELSEHGSYVSDSVKIDAYRRALTNLVRPGDVVLDMGCGTGLLGLLALEAGAARVVAVDSGPILELARETFEANGVGDRVDYLRVRSSELTLAEPADVLVCDQIGGFAHEVGLTRNVRDLLDRAVLKPDARIVPDSFDLYVAPVTAPEGDDPLRAWTAAKSGLDFAPFRRSAANSPFRLTATADWLLGAGVHAAHLDARSEDNVRFDVTSHIHTAGTVTGILGYMRAHLDPAGGVSLTNDPTDPGHFRRWHLYHPVDPAIDVAAGDDITMSFDINQRGQLTNWRVSANGERRSASQFFGDFLDPLVMFDPSGDRIPPLSRAGECRRATLDAIAAGVPFSGLVEMIVDNYGDQFATDDDARRYARDMVARYCERS
jgi:type I protein arginine methyltransferase